MQKYLFFSILFILTISLNAQSGSFWKHIEKLSILEQRSQAEQYTPEAFAAFELDHPSLATFLLNAPKEFSSNEKSFRVDLPTPEGRTRAFEVFYSPVMQEELAAKYPEIRSYKGYALDDRSTNVRFNISPRGLRAAIHGENNIYIDPATEDNPNQYIVYYTRDYKEDVSGVNISCGLDPYDILEEDLNSEEELNMYPDEILNTRNITAECDSVSLYTYRLALSCTGEWAQAHGGTVESVLADMVTSVNRINQIYENEFSIRVILINDNDQLIWLDPDTDPFEVANVGYELLQANTIVLNNNVGVNSYDIGHVFTRSCVDVGGVASLGSVCSANRKGSAVTCHYSNNLNYIITNVMAHEMGHQFSASHTFNNCNGNESAGSDYEPGGGVTIMAYCGLCGGNNVDYTCLENFHAHSIEQVRNFTRIGGGKKCANIISTGNTAPEVTLDYTDGFSIPIGTPFKLEGNAIDCEGDELTYSWEQWDIGPQVPVGQPIEDAPLFTAMEPRAVPYRLFPDITKIVNNFSNNSEVLPAYTRPMNFRFIVRDNNENGGGTSWENVMFRAEGEAGPFRITAPASFQTYEVGDEIEIRWDVANTDIAPVNCSHVNIWLSSDAGYTDTKLLKFQTPNDGSEKIILPNIVSSLIRFKVEAVDNIFFNISSAYTQVEEPEEPSYYIEPSPIYQQVCLPDLVSVDISTEAFNNYNEMLSFEVAGGLPEGAEYSFVPSIVEPGQPVSLEIDLSDVNFRDLYELEIHSISASGDTLKRTVELDVVTNDYSDVAILHPLPGATGQGQVIDMAWTDSQSADKYNVYLSTNPAFNIDETWALEGTSDTTFSPMITLDKSTVYYWKIEGVNECGSRDASEILTFSTEAFSCKTFKSEDESQDIRSLDTSKMVITIDENTEVADVNIISISGDHDNFYDLDGILEGPDGTRVGLFAAKCYINGAVKFDFGLDDESTQKFKCPPSSGVFYPSGELSKFKGISAAGDWTLQIYDRQKPKGGELENFELEICANSVLANPYIVNNESYKVAIGLAWDLPSSKLKTEDEDNLPEELIYTLVELPIQTSILKNGSTLQIGDQFSEADIRNGNIQLFSNNAVDGDVDEFVFTVIDGNGGWLDKTTFSFVLDAQVSVKSVDLDNQINVYPNPGTDHTYVNILESGSFDLDLYDLTGKILQSHKLNGFERKQLIMSGYEPGVYYLKIRNEQKYAVRKLILQ
jgi:hypothetical protein